MPLKICHSNPSNNNFKFFCEKCDYGCNKLFLFNQHKKTKKHQNEKCSKMLIENMQHHKCSCGRIYKHVQSYNRHIKQCTQYIASNMDKEKNELKGIITTLITQNQNMLLENQEMREMVKGMIPKIGNNNTTINNKFNLQFFLNEECKDAINLTDFVKTLQLELDDLDKTRKNGYVSGITNIFVRGLKELELHKRPIHCSDLKREVLYVKDNDTWEKDNNEKQIMKQAINTVAKKQIDIIKEWEASNPNWNSTEAGTKMYIDMVKNVTDTSDSENKIIKTIAKEVIIEK
jgi:hypothetical protein